MYRHHGFTLKEMKCISVVCVDLFHLIKWLIDTKYSLLSCFPLHSNSNAEFQMITCCIILHPKKYECVHTVKSLLLLHKSSLMHHNAQSTPSFINVLIALSPINLFQMFSLRNPPTLHCKISTFHFPLLPSSLTELTLGDVFNRPVNNLPSSIFKLKFGKQFNQLIDNLPPSLYK